MSMRLQSAGVEPRTTAATTGSGAVAAPAGVAATSTPSPPPPLPQAGEGNGRYAGFVASQAQINQQASGLQQALAYLDRLLPSLRDVARRLGGAPKGAASAALAESLQQVQKQWQQRAQASAGRLDNNLQPVAAGQAQQAFTLRGLDQRALFDAAAETLVFHPRGLGRPARVLALDEAGEPAARLGQLQSALAPAGIGVAEAEAGALVFTVAETAWPALRDQLLVQGGGQRFPSGRPSRVLVEPQAAELEPARWQIGSKEQRQQSFRQASAALIRGERSQAELRRQLAEVAGELQSGRGQDAPQQAAQLAASFTAGLQQEAGYRRLATAGACLRGISRQRVGAVLGR